MPPEEPPRPYRVRNSPSLTSDKVWTGSIEDRIDVYEDRLAGWTFAPIRMLLAMPGADFAVLHLALAYFEGWAQYRWGEDSHNRSEEFFIRGVKAVFPKVTLDVPDRGDAIGTELTLLYRQARCGAFHDGIMRRQVLVKRTGVPLAFAVHRDTLEVRTILIDPAAFVGDIEEHSRRYIAAIRDAANAEIRSNFMRTWDRQHGGEPLRLPPYLPRPSS